MLLSKKSSITDFGFKKSVQNGSQNNSQRCINICQHLSHYGNERDIFINRIIINDETQTHHCEPVNKWQSLGWKHPQSPGRNTFKSQPSTGKLVLTAFWDSLGLVLNHYQERSTTINSACYSEMLTSRLNLQYEANVEDCCHDYWHVVLLNDRPVPHCWNPPKLRFDVVAHARTVLISPLLSLVRSTQRSIKWPSSHLGPSSKGRGACRARCSAENIRELVHWKSRGLYWKIVLM
jgi:hypothetical protein